MDAVHGEPTPNLSDNTGDITLQSGHDDSILVPPPLHEPSATEVLSDVYADNVEMHKAEVDASNNIPVDVRIQSRLYLSSYLRSRRLGKVRND